MSISIKPFGKTPSGENAELYILKNKSGASVSITNFGGILNAISVPDREGNLGDVLLGYSSVEGYTPLNRLYRRADRSRGQPPRERRMHAEPERPLHLAKNEAGRTHLHGGDVGFDRKLWQATPIEGICEDSLILKYTSPDGEEGYPARCA